MFCRRERLASQKILVRAVPDKGTIKSGENFIRSAVDSKEALAPGKFLQIPERIVSDGSRINLPFMLGPLESSIYRAAGTSGAPLSWLSDISETHWRSFHHGHRPFYRPRHCGVRNRHERHRAYVFSFGTGNNTSDTC
jgi:hypothetical protein